MARGRPDDGDIDNDAPWLAEGVREGRASTLVPRGRVIGGVSLFLALLILLGLGIYVISGRKQDGSGGFKRPEDAPLIAADAGPYKLAPTDPGGAVVAGVDDSIAAAGRGDNPGSAIDTAAVPEEPLARTGENVAGPPTDLLPPQRVAAPVAKAPSPVVPSPVKAAPVVPAQGAVPVVPAVADKPKPTKPQPEIVKAPKPDPLAEAAPPKPSKASGNAALQLGAFSTAAKADAAWTAAVGHAPALGGLTKRVEPIDRDGKTLYRLRASGVASKAAATELCAKVKADGDACLVVE